MKTAAALAAFFFLSLNLQAKSMHEQIKNSRGQIIGILEETSGRIVVKNAQGQTVGYYVRSENKTYRANATYVGPGDQTRALLN